MIEMTVGQTLGNWYHFIKPIRLIKNLLSVVSYLGYANRNSDQCFYRECVYGAKGAMARKSSGTTDVANTDS
jgi:hypothetical protein